MVGIAAIADTVARGGRAVVLVPGVELQDQWCASLDKLLPKARVDRLGNSSRLSRGGWNVAVAIINSASAPGAARMLKPAELLVADECHGYGAPTFSRALRADYTRRLGLTATYERNDNGIAEYLDPFFGGVVTTYDYRRAVPEGVVAPFALALLGVTLTAVERERYDELTEEIVQLTVKLKPHCDPAKPFMEEVSHLAASIDRIGLMANKFLSRVSERLGLLTSCEGKQHILPQLSPLMQSGGTLVFTEKKEAAERAAAQCRDQGLIAEALHSDVDRLQRRDVLRRFKGHEVQVLCAPRVLDQGVDVPEADLGIVLAATKTRRQMVQRMGRVLRKKADGGHARFVIVFVEDTIEDPQTGAHESFLDMVLEVAARSARFPAGTSAGVIGDFLTLPISPSERQHFRPTKRDADQPIPAQAVPIEAPPVQSAATTQPVDADVPNTPDVALEPGSRLVEAERAARSLAEDRAAELERRLSEQLSARLQAEHRLATVISERDAALSDRDAAVHGRKLADEALGVRSREAQAGRHAVEAARLEFRRVVAAREAEAGSQIAATAADRDAAIADRDAALQAKQLAERALEIASRDALAARTDLEGALSKHRDIERARESERASLLDELSTLRMAAADAETAVSRLQHEHDDLRSQMQFLAQELSAARVEIGALRTQAFDSSVVEPGWASADAPATAAPPDLRASPEADVTDVGNDLSPSPPAPVGTVESAPDQRSATILPTLPTRKGWGLRR
jgi:RNA polymerase primary sigma factor